MLKKLLNIIGIGSAVVPANYPHVPVLSLGGRVAPVPRQSMKPIQHGGTPKRTAPVKYTAIRSKKSLKRFNPTGAKSPKGDVIFTYVKRKNPFRGIVGPRWIRGNRNLDGLNPVQVIVGVQQVD